MGEQFKIFLIIFHSRPPSLVRILESLYHKFARQESLFSCTKFVNDKIIQHEVRQMQSIWILESLYHKFAFFCNTLLRYKNFTLFYKNLSISWLWILHKVAIINLVREKKLVLIFTVYINSNENAEIS